MKFEKWDKVIFKTWEKMKEEFWLTFKWSVNCKKTFVEDMKQYIWKDYIIEDIIDYEIILNPTISYQISEDMLELVPETYYEQWRRIYVNDYETGIYQKRLLITSLPWKTREKHICVLEWWEEAFKNWEEYGFKGWKFMKLEQEEVKKTITLDNWKVIYLTSDDIERIWSL